MHRPNRYLSGCYFCKQTVPYMQGWLKQKTINMPDVQGNFIVVCKPCFEAHRKELHPAKSAPFVGTWDMDKSPRRHLFNRGGK